MDREGKPVAHISVDLDPVDTHLQGYGFESEDRCDLIYRTAVPRLLDLFSELDVRVTLFVVARDALPQRELWREAVARGHEVASHSWTHPVPFRGLDDTALCHEVEASREALSHATGEDVVGFRAPAWDVDDRVLLALEKAGYRYDSSIFPTPVLLASRLMAWLRGSGKKKDVLSMQVLGHALASVEPHPIEVCGGRLTEVPISVTPLLRLPYYHTFSYFVPPWLYELEYRSIVRARIPMSYELHAADLLDLDGDGVDRRMARHPGMNLPVTVKRRRLREILGAIAQDFRVVPIRESLHGAAPPKRSEADDVEKIRLAAAG